jgi:phosphoribosylformimino-5-aminoimidazole carboxamide ribotide isomerase
VRVIGVIDLLEGRGVHARAGPRANYQPVQVIAGTRIDSGDVLAIAHAYLDRFGLAELYVADLDAIAGGMLQHAIIGRLASLGMPLWLDAGISSLDRARLAVDLGASFIIIGLETLSSFDALAGICTAVQGSHVAFSLDLRDGVPIGSAGADLEAQEIAVRAAAAGATSVIVLDLGRVGTGGGPDVGTIVRIRRTLPDVTLLAGGGVRGLADLRTLAASGCDGALVATAVHQGQLSAAELAMAKAL